MLSTAIQNYVKGIDFPLSSPILKYEPDRGSPGLVNNTSYAYDFLVIMSYIKIMNEKLMMKEDNAMPN